MGRVVIFIVVRQVGQSTLYKGGGRHTFSALIPTIFVIIRGWPCLQSNGEPSGEKSSIHIGAPFLYSSVVVIKHVSSSQCGGVDISQCLNGVMCAST